MAFADGSIGFCNIGKIISIPAWQHGQQSHVDTEYDCHILHQYEVRCYYRKLNEANLTKMLIVLKACYVFWRFNICWPDTLNVMLPKTL